MKKKDDQTPHSSTLTSLDVQPSLVRKGSAAMPNHLEEQGMVDCATSSYLAESQSREKFPDSRLNLILSNQVFLRIKETNDKVGKFTNVARHISAKFKIAENRAAHSPSGINSISKQSLGLACMELQASQISILSRIASNMESKFIFDRSRRERFLDGVQKIASFADGLLRAYEKRFACYPKLAENLTSLAKQGWFVSLDLPLSVYEELAFSLESLPVNSNETILVDNIFVAHFQQEIERLCSSLIEKNPHRAFAIKPAVAAHLRGEYALSVPVFFSQAEGVVRDRTERELFTKPPRKPEVHVSDWAGKKRIAVQQAEDPFDHFEDALWSPLCLDLPITWGPKERKDHEYIGLNRHTTLHGMDLDYASEVNSLKAFSLLCYVSSVLSSDPGLQVEEDQE